MKRGHLLILVVLFLLSAAAGMFYVVNASAQCADGDLMCQSMP